MSDYSTKANFRDLAHYDKQIKPGLIYRSNSLTFLIEQEFFELVRGNHIGSVIDLRSNDEVAMDPYESYMLEYINYFHVPIDPSRVNSNFDPTGMAIRSMEDIYRFFVKHCKPQVKEVFEILARELQDGILMHCFAGRDRTGFMAALIHMLRHASYNTIVEDYTASTLDTSPEYIKVVYNEVKRLDGIRNYLLICGLTHETIDQVAAELTPDA